LVRDKPWAKQLASDGLASSWRAMGRSNRDRSDSQEEDYSG
jgi:hypothetical protein